LSRVAEAEPAVVKAARGCWFYPRGVGETVVQRGVICFWRGAFYRGPHVQAGRLGHVQELTCGDTIHNEQNVKKIT